MQTQILSHALKFAQIGWKVLPLHSVRGSQCSCGKNDCKNQGKHPRINRWQEECSHESSRIHEWWKQWPDANIGIATGSKSGIVVLDIDQNHGGYDSLKQLISENGPLPETLAAKSGGGGMHFYFQCPAERISNRVNILPGIDVRGEGGNIVAPPSQHRSGSQYSWSKEPRSEHVLAAPPWLVNFFIRPKHAQVTSALIGEGERNNFLAQEAGKLRRVGLGSLELEHELQDLNQNRCTPPLDVNEVTRIASSIARYPSPASKYSFVPKVEWNEDPLELPSTVISVPPLSEKLIPKNLRPWIMDISDRMQVCPEFVIAPALVALSSVVGRKIGIYPKEHDNWLTLPNLFGAIVARPGYCKSPTIAEALKPLEVLISAARKAFEIEKQAVSSSDMVAGLQIEALKDQIKRAIKDDNHLSVENLRFKIEEIENAQKNIRTVEKRYKTNDATVEKVARLLNENPNGILLLRDELNGWLQTLNKAGREGDREFYLEAWNGYGSYCVDRVGSGTLHVPALCLSVFGGIQPGKLKSYVEKASQNGAEDDGLLQRFQILIYPDLDPKWENIDRIPNVLAREQVDQLFKTLDEMKIPTEEDQIPGVRFNSEAQIIFNEWRQNLEKRLRSGELESPAFESHLAKFRSLMPSLALLFWLIDNPEGISADSKVTVEAAQMAIGWCEFLEQHARKVYGITHSSELNGAQVLAKKIQHKQVVDQMPLRAIIRKHWSGLATSTEVDNSVAMLEDHHWLKVMTTNVQGGSSRRILLHPKFLG